MPGAGSVVSAVEAASGVTPVSIGKPEPLLLEEACRVGGARCVLMLTGVTTRAQLDALPPAERPTAVAADAAELAAVLDRLAERT